MPSIFSCVDHLHGRGYQGRYLGHVARHDECGFGILRHLAVGNDSLLGHFQLHCLFTAWFLNGRGYAFNGLGRGFGYSQN